jgi:hypothetical protein
MVPEKQQRNEFVSSNHYFINELKTVVIPQHIKHLRRSYKFTLYIALISLQFTIYKIEAISQKSQSNS